MLQRGGGEDNLVRRNPALQIWQTCTKLVDNWPRTVKTTAAWEKQTQRERERVGVKTKLERGWVSPTQHIHHNTTQNSTSHMIPLEWSCWCSLRRLMNGKREGATLCEYEAATWSGGLRQSAQQATQLYGRSINIHQHDAILQAGSAASCSILRERQRQREREEKVSYSMLYSLALDFI